MNEKRLTNNIRKYETTKGYCLLIKQDEGFVVIFDGHFNMLLETKEECVEQIKELLT